MEPSTSKPSGKQAGPRTAPDGAPAHRRRTIALRTRRALARQTARTRIGRHTTVDLSDATRALDPMSPRWRSRARRAAALALLVGLSLAVHLAVVLTGIIAGRQAADDAANELIRIEMAPPPPPPPPEPEPPAPEPPPEPEKVVERPRPKLAEPPPPEPPPTAKPPPRVVGLSLDSTVGGGTGPAFAVGNTREGKTAAVAVDAKDVAPVGVVDAPPPAPNQVATRIPTVGVKFVPAKRKFSDRKPPYPEVLKSQGIEGDVTVMITVSPEGKVVNVKVLGTSPYPELVEAAKQFAPTEEYEPATRDGKPVAATFTFTFKFRIEDQ